MTSVSRGRNLDDVTLPQALPSPRERQSDATRARLFGAAVAEFRRRGLARARVSDIARAAGVSRPLFYFHFPTKEHVLLELQYGLELEVVEELKRCRSLRQALHLFTGHLLETPERVGSEDLAREMLALYARRPAALALEGRAYPAFTEVVRLFREAAARGELREGLEPDRAARVCLTNVLGLLLGVPAPIEERRADFELLFSLYLREDAP